MMPQNEEDLATVFTKGAENFKQFNCPLPAGERYSFLLKKVELGKNKKSQKPMITEIYRVMVGAWEGKELRMFTMLNNHVSWSICLGRWLKMGYDASAVSSLKEVEEYCDAITSAQHLVTGLVSDEGDQGQFKKISIEAVSRSKKEEPTTTGNAPATQAAPAPKAEEKKAAPIPEEPASEDSPAPVPAPAASQEAATEEEEATLGLGDTCEYTFRGAPQHGIVKEMHPANPDKGELEDKVTFLTEGKPFKVKSANILRIVKKNG